MSRPTLHYDLGSPYAYLAATRATEVLGVEPTLHPVLVGGIFTMRGHGSWSQTPERQARIEEIEARARRYGIEPLRWPEGWPNNTLVAMRAATWAVRQGRGREFARLGFHRAFLDGGDLSDLEEVVEVGRGVGLDGEELREAVGRQEIKDALRAATEDAWSRGVVGVPCIEVEGRIFYGDDRLEDAAAFLGAAP